MMETKIPIDLDAEQSTLGSMLLERDALLAGFEMLKSNDFYRPAHSIIFGCMQSIENRLEPIDLVTLTNELKKRNKLNDCGGARYLMALIETVPTAANIKYYARIVRNYASRRRIIANTDKIKALAYDLSCENISDTFLQIANDTRQYDLAIGNNTKNEFSISELLAGDIPDIEKLELAGQPIINKGYAHLISAAPKTGKTEITIRSVLKWHSEKILFVTEESKILWQIRLKRLGISNNINNISFLMPGAMTTSDILNKIKESDATVVVIDTLRSIMRLEDENSNSKSTRDILPLTLICKDAEKTLIVLHHSKKNFDDGSDEVSRSSGAYAIVGLFDKVISISGSSDKLKLSATGRLEPSFDCFLHWNPDTNNIESLDNDKKNRDLIIEYLESIGTDAKPMDIVEATGIGKNQLYKLLKSLTDDGLLYRTKQNNGNTYSRFCVSADSLWNAET